MFNFIASHLVVTDAGVAARAQCWLTFSAYVAKVHSTNLSIGYINDVKLFVGADATHCFSFHVQPRHSVQESWISSASSALR